MNKFLKLVLIFTIGALLLGGAINYTLMGLDYIFSIGFKQVSDESLSQHLLALYSKGAALLMIWPVAGVISDFYVGADKK